MADVSSSAHAALNALRQSAFNGRGMFPIAMAENTGDDKLSLITIPAR